MTELAASFLTVFVGLFPIVNPLGMAPIFLRLTSDATERTRAKLAWHIAVGGFVLMAVSLFIGSHILAFFGLTITAVQIAGGLVVMAAGWRMLQQGHDARVREQQSTASEDTIMRRAFFPLTMPLTVGPGTISGAITLGTRGAETKRLLLTAAGGKIARDISERKQKEEHIALLSREMDHRARNLLGLVQASVHLAQGDTPDALKKAIGGRIQALANVHALLAQSHWAGADIRNLVAEELSPYSPDGESRAQLIGPNLLLKPKSAQTVAVALHELTTNAVKYGSLSVPAGRVKVEWSLGAGGKLVIVWTESNGPPVEPPSRRGFGTLLVEQVVKGELKGDAHVDWRPEGLVCRLILDPTIEF